MMNKAYILAVDGGATKTHAAVMHLPTTRIWLAESGPTNHEVLPGGFDDLPAALGGAVDKVLAQAGIAREDIAYGVFGMAGDDLPYQHARIGRIIEALGFDNYKLFNDSCLPILAATKEGRGIGLINGTGFSVSGIDADGVTGQMGGFGALSDDFGGGTWYGEQAVAAVYRNLYKRARATLLTDYMLKAFGLDHSRSGELMERISRGLLEDTKETRRKLAVCLHEAGTGGDLTARAILEKSATEYAICVINLLNRYNFASMQEVPVVLCGSGFVKGSKVLHWVLQELLPEKCRMMVFEQPPVAGALYEACRGVDFAVTDAFRAYAAGALASAM